LSTPPPADEPTTIRVAAAGDVHCRESNRGRIVSAFASLDAGVDLVLLAGDLTSHGEPAEAEILAEAAAAVKAPVYAVLGNHDLHAGREEEIATLLEDAGVRVLRGEAEVCCVGDVEVGIVGAKGFVGGFAPRHLPDFGESSLRDVYDETGREVEAIDAGLRRVATSPLRIVLLHYAPVERTLEGEPPEIHVFLGSDRLAAPIAEHGADVVLHGHAHAGALEGRIGEVPVYNVSVPVIGRDFWILELEVAARAAGPIP
jgi:Icc-related predicted phosphoesterase